MAFVRKLYKNTSPFFAACAHLFKVKHLICFNRLHRLVSTKIPKLQCFTITIIKIFNSKLMQAFFKHHQIAALAQTMGAAKVEVLR